MSTPLHYLTIAEAAERLRLRQLSPVELTKVHLQRIEALEPKLHAFITVTAEDALAQACTAEREIASGHYRGLLHGIPIAHKDIVWTRGVRTTAHSALLKDWVPAEDATIVERLRAAGAITLGKTALHEFAYGTPADDDPFPPALNPWNLAHAPGSSSSGSGAAVAAGLAMAATGTDTGGSVRHPASVCGIVGMKPTFGAVSVHGVIPLAPSLDHVGPLTRTVRDSAVVLQAMAGYDPKDPTTSKVSPPEYSALIGTSIEGLQLGVPRSFIQTYPHLPEVVQAFENALTVLRELGADIRDVDSPGAQDAIDALNVIIGYESYRYHRGDFSAHPEKYGTVLRERMRKASAITAAEYEEALEKKRKVSAAFRELMAGGIAAIVSPGRETAADTLHEMMSNPTRRPVTNRIYSVTGMPAMTIPMGFNDAGLPLALQIAAAHRAEPLIYQIGAAYEDATRWSDRHPPL
jgi:aspartyl-tRNA(Asn)/glutamyl-tRNA(Gln) amidotransferase subunit A